MTRDEAIERIRPQAAELRTAGMSAPYPLGFSALRLRIGAAVDSRVDRVIRRSMRAGIRQRAEAEMVRIS